MEIISVSLPPPVHVMMWGGTKSYSLSEPYLEDKSMKQKSKANLIWKKLSQIKRPENDSRSAVFQAVHKMVLPCYPRMFSACQVRNDAF